MKWILIAVAALIALVVVVAVVGSMLPRDHVASRQLRLRQPPDAVWRLVADFQLAPTWRPDVKRMERLPDRNGHAVWVEHGSNGAMPLEVVEHDPPRRLVTRIADPKMPFGGTWTYDIAPAASPGGSHAPDSILTITEAGWVSNPIFRFVSHVFFDQHAAMDAYLKSVTAKFNEPPALSGG